MAILKVPYNGEWAIIESPSAVKFTEQALSEADKARARANIGAAAVGEVGGSVQSDWNQNDETALDYVKNRTHWYGDPVENILLDNITIEIEDHTTQENTYTAVIKEGLTYHAIFDGVTYELIGKRDGDFTYIGSDLLWEGEIEGAQPPFFYSSMLSRYDQGMFVAVTDGTHTVSIIELTPEAHKIDVAFLPDGATIGVYGTGHKAEIFNEGSTASGDYSHAEGLDTEATGYAAHAEGERTTASGGRSHAEGNWTTASGVNSHAEGNHSKATGDYSHAEGYQAKATGDYSHAEGEYTEASGDHQHVQGKYNVVSSNYAHIVGNGTSNSKRSNAHTLDWDGNAWFAGEVKVGTDRKILATTEYVDNAVSNGGVQPDWNQNDETAPDYVKNRTHWAEETEGTILADNVSVDTGEYGHYAGNLLGNSEDLEVESPYTVIFDGVEYNLICQWDSRNELPYLGDYTFITASGPNPDFSATNPPFCFWGSHFAASTGGVHTVTIKSRSFYYHKIDANFLPDGASIGTFGTEGYAEKFNLASAASGHGSHAEGGFTTASGTYSHAEGYKTTASESQSHAEGRETTASGVCSHAEGNGTTASGSSSHAEGLKTTASSNYQHVQGTYNIEDTDNKYAHIVGNGDYRNRSNAHTIDWNGVGWFAGDVKVGGTSQNDSAAKTLATTEYVDNAIVEKGFNGSWNSLTDRPFGETGNYLFYDEHFVRDVAADHSVYFYAANPNIGSALTSFSTSDTFTVILNGEVYNNVPYFIGIMPDGADPETGESRYSTVHYLGKLREWDFVNGTIPEDYDANDWSFSLRYIVATEREYFELDFSDTDETNHTPGYIVSLCDSQGVQVEKIDAKYLPDNLATTEYVDNAVANGGSGITTIGMSGTGEHSEIFNTASIASGDYSHAEGFNSTAAGLAAHAENHSTATGKYSHAEGMGEASGDYAHSEGGAYTFGFAPDSPAMLAMQNATVYTVASGTLPFIGLPYGFAKLGRYGVGESNIISYDETSITVDKTLNPDDDIVNDNWNGEDWYVVSVSLASGEAAHNEGHSTQALGNYSHAEGNGTVAAGEAQHVQGKFNIADTEDKYAHIVGNGDGVDNSNAHTLDWDGNAWFAGEVKVGGEGQDDPAAKTLATTEYVNNALATGGPTINIDSTLSIQGAVADAKATGDAIGENASLYVNETEGAALPDGYDLYIDIADGYDVIPVSGGGTDATDAEGALRNLGVVRHYAPLTNEASAIIAESSDLNTVEFFKVGTYYQYSSDTVRTLSNCPTDTAFMMTVYAPAIPAFDEETTSTWVYRVRKIMTCMGEEYIQYVHSTSPAGSFACGDWQRILTSGDGSGVGSLTYTVVTF
jgi:hypothetical protein